MKNEEGVTLSLSAYLPVSLCICRSPLCICRSLLLFPPLEGAALCGCLYRCLDVGELDLNGLQQGIRFCNNPILQVHPCHVQITELLVAIFGKDVGDKIGGCQTDTHRTHNLNLSFLGIEEERPLRWLLIAPLFRHTRHCPVHRTASAAQ